MSTSIKPSLEHYFLCSDCSKKNLTEQDAGKCCQGIAEEFTWDDELQDWYIVPFTNFKRWTR